MHTVTVLPGPILCGNCGTHMRQEAEYRTGATSVVLACWRHDCEQCDVRLVFPIEVRELQRSDA